MTAFGRGACAWFAGLEANNTKSYFAETKPVFEAEIKAPMQELLTRAQGKFGGEAKLFRQHRDVRFSRDKSPYKTATYGGVYDPARVMGWYMAVDAHGFFAGLGIYQMPPAQLTRFRDAVASDKGAGLANAMAKAIAAGLDVSGDSLKAAPRGYDNDHDRIDILRRKNLILGARIGPDELTGDAPWNHATKTWTAAAPVANWMDRALG